MSPIRQIKAVRERILAEAEQLILLQGFNGTSIDVICSRAKVTKGAFFYYFDSKEDLASFILRKYWTDTVDRLGASSYMRIKDPFKRLLGIISFFEEIFEIPKRPSACLIGNITQEVALTNDTVRATCDEIFSEWIAMLSDLIKEIIELKKPKQKIDAKGLAELIISAVEGAFTLTKATEDISGSKRVLKHLKNYLRLLFD